MEPFGGDASEMNLIAGFCYADILLRSYSLSLRPESDSDPIVGGDIAYFFK